MAQASVAASARPNRRPGEGCIMANSLFSLEGRTALVTGASRGLGKAGARGFAEAGAELVLAARDVAKLEEVAGQIRANGGKGSICAFELGNLNAVEESLGEILARTEIDILVNNGAIGG